MKHSALFEDGRVFIIPIRLERCKLPDALSRLQRVDLFKPGGYKKLIRSLHKQEEQ